MADLKAVYVVEGDTLWSLVDQHYDTDDDIREAIFQVKKINDIENGLKEHGINVSIVDTEHVFSQGYADAITNNIERAI